MEIFIDIVENHIHKLKETSDFSTDALLNINSIKDISYVMKNYYETLNIYKAKKNVLMKDFHDLRRKISKLNATTDVSDENRALLKRLEEQFHTSFKTIANSEDLGTATNMLFDAVEINLNPDDQIAKCEAIKEAIIKEIQTIEQQYYKHINKKKAFLEAEKATPKLEF